jgi:hypothetical protein
MFCWQRWPSNEKVRATKYTIFSKNAYVPFRSMETNGTLLPVSLQSRIAKCMQSPHFMLCHVRTVSLINIGIPHRIATLSVTLHRVFADETDSIAMTRVSVVPALALPLDFSDVVEWSFPSHLESEITTLAAWCQVKQQQRVPLSSSEDSEDESTANDEVRTDINVLDSSFSDGDAALKKDFLDRLAELLCFKKTLR